MCVQRCKRDGNRCGLLEATWLKVFILSCSITQLEEYKRNTGAAIVCWNVASVGWLWLKKPPQTCKSNSTLECIIWTRVQMMMRQFFRASFALDHWKVAVPPPTAGPTLPPGLCREATFLFLINCYVLHRSYREVVGEDGPVVYVSYVSNQHFHNTCSHHTYISWLSSQEVEGLSAGYQQSF